MNKMVNLLHEVGMLAYIPRSGFAFLGSGTQSVAEHSFRTAIIAYAMARQSPEPVDLFKLIMICLFHDLPESRIGDLNYMQKKYVEANLSKALTDIEKGSSCGSEVVQWINEYEENKTIEAKFAHDADQLELLLVLKREYELGNQKALTWFENGRKRLKTPLAQQMAESILQHSSDDWWLENRTDPHWIDGGKSKKTK